MKDLWKVLEGGRERHHVQGDTGLCPQEAQDSLLFLWKVRLEASENPIRRDSRNQKCLEFWGIDKTLSKKKNHQILTQGKCIFPSSLDDINAIKMKKRNCYETYYHS